MICHECGRNIKSLGFASHRAMHYRKRKEKNTMSNEDKKVMLSIDDIGNLINLVEYDKMRIDTTKSYSYESKSQLENKIHALMYLDLLIDKLRKGLK